MAKLLMLCLTQELRLRVSISKPLENVFHLDNDQKESETRVQQLVRQERDLTVKEPLPFHLLLRELSTNSLQKCFQI